MIWNYLLWSAIGFLSGSVMYSYLLPKYLFNKDITKISKDGNPGCGNVFTCIGIPSGILCLLLELMKGAMPVWLAMQCVDEQNIMFSLVLSAPVFGHAFSPMLKNHGGKSIAVSFGTFIGICPHSMLLFWLALPLVIFSTIIRICPHSLRVMSSFAIMFVISLFCEKSIMAMTAAFLVAGVVIFKHFGDFVNREKMQTDIYLFTHCLYHHGASDEAADREKA